MLKGFSKMGYKFLKSSKSMASLNIPEEAHTGQKWVCRFHEITILMWKYWFFPLFWRFSNYLWNYKNFFILELYCESKIFANFMLPNVENAKIFCPVWANWSSNKVKKEKIKAWKSYYSHSNLDTENFTKKYESKVLKKYEILIIQTGAEFYTPY